MTFKKIAFASIAALMATTSAQSAGLELFGVNGTNGTPVGPSVVFTPFGPSLVSPGTDGRANAVAKTDAKALFTQQSIGNADVTATLNATSSSSPLTAVQGASGSSKVTSTGSITETNLLTISNSAINAAAQFSADSLVAGNIGGTARAAGTETMVAQQALSDAKTTATATFTNAMTTNTSISNSAMGAAAVITLNIK
ncbi:hypothetical protein SAMN05877838_0002 [Hoeflea halophila]|uniref:Uncharacterized protein n=1 Tax=Hoeflea halophila TaxID=714899 RepID=A0A286HKE1_9HYPH|nr:hypothetical protein [Hoeflea halophila]SOE08293.1 hypothetical protein SAMN05877838_0002 [Hoeflea halophila]